MFTSPPLEFLSILKQVEIIQGYLTVHLNHYSSVLPIDRLGWKSVFDKEYYVLLVIDICPASFVSMNSNGDFF